MNVRDQVRAARTTTDWLLRELATFTAEELELPNACGVWNVAEELAHLVWVADLYADGIRRGLQGDVTARPGREMSTVYDERAKQIAQVAVESRQQLGDQLLAAFARVSNTLLELFESLEPGDWQTPAYHVSGIKSPEQLLQLFIVEVSVHGWDLLRRTARPIPLPDACQETIVDWLPIRMRGSFRPRERLAEPLRFLFAMTSPVLRLIHLRINGDSFDVDPRWDESGSDAVFTLGPDAYILLFMDRFPWSEAIDTGIVAVTGNTARARQLPAWFGLT
jgi:uncharacterized protein (TIGR03083 family)